MRKGISILLAILMVFSLGFFVATPNENVTSADAPHFYQIGTIGMMPDDYVGAFALETANTYEDDFKSNYSYPMQGMTTTSDGNIVICDTSYGRVHILDTNMQNELTFGELGMGDGKLQYPADIAVDKDGNFYVADFFNNYWAKFDKNGKWILNAGSEGSGDGQLNGPSGIAISNGEVFVSDQLNGRIAIFKTDGTFVKNVYIDGLKNPGGMCADADGNILVVGMNKCKVLKLSPEDMKVISSFGDKGAEDGKFVYPFDVTTDSQGNIYVVDRGLASTLHPVIEKFDKTGKFIMNIGGIAKKLPQPNGTFFDPAGCTVDKDGNVFVIDAGFFHGPGNPFGFPSGVRLTEFDSQGDFAAKKDFDVNTEGRLMNTWGACRDSKGQVWATSWNGFSDAGEVDIFSKGGKFMKKISKVGDDKLVAVGDVIANGKGQVFAATGNFIVEFDENGNFVKEIGKGKVSNIYGLAFDKNGNLWAASNGTQSIVGFEPDGTFISQFSTRHAPTGLTIDGNGNFYFTSVDDNKVYIYTPKGKYKRAFGGPGRGLGKFWIPYGISMGPNGEILVADTENGRIQAFDGKTYKLLWSTPRAYYEPAMMHWGGDGNLYVGDAFHSVVRILSTKPPHISDYSFALSASVSTLQIAAGKSAKFNLIIKNTGKTDDSYKLTMDAGSLPVGWKVSDIPAEVKVKSRDQSLIPVTVTTTPDSPPETSGTIDFTAVSEGDSTVSHSSSVKVEIPKAPPIEVSIAPTNIPLNQSSELDVVFSKVKDLYGVAVTIQYDPKALKIDDVKPSGILGDDAIFLTNYKKPGVIIIGYTLKGSAEGIEAKGSMVKIMVTGLKEGTTQMQISELQLTDSKGKVIDSESNAAKIEVYNPVPPNLTVEITDGEVTDQSSLYFTGKTDPGCNVTVNGDKVKVNDNGSFVANVYLNDGPNTITIVSTNKYNISKKLTLTVILQTKTIITLQPNNPMMTVNGVKQEIDPGRGTKPVIIAKWSRTVVPIRAIVEALGGTIGWDGTERKVTINFKDTVIELWIDKPQASVNGVMKWIDEGNHNVKPIIVNGRTMLPLRFVAENLGCQVDWDPATKTITITYPGS